MVYKHPFLLSILLALPHTVGIFAIVSRLPWQSQHRRIILDLPQK